jgi:succinyl-diaminopimelate desuccinylase
MTDQNDYVIDLCSELIKINTANPPGNEKRAVDFCRHVLSSSGLDMQIIQHAENRASLLAIMEGQPNGRTFLIVGHLDTVPVSDPPAWKIDPFCGYHDHEKLSAAVHLT